MNLHSCLGPHFPFRIYRSVAVLSALLAALISCGPAFCDQIHDAAKNGDLTKVKALVQDNPGLVSSKDESGATPLHYAALGGHQDVADFLLANKAEVNARTTSSLGGTFLDGGATPLHVAALMDRGGVVELLLANHAEVNAKENNGTTPLHAAASSGAKKVVKLLLASKADASARDANGLTPLDVANAFAFLNKRAGSVHPSEADYKDVIEMLGPHGSEGAVTQVQPPASTADSFREIHDALRHDDRAKVQELLNRYPTLIESKERGGDTLLHVAAGRGNKAMLELLLANAADINARNDNGKTPLYHAVTFGRKETVELLLDHKADLNAKDKSGDTPLYWASLFGNKDVVESLLAKGADVRVEDNEGRTALHAATYLPEQHDVLFWVNATHTEPKGATQALMNRYKETVELLLDHGADVNARNFKGETPLRKATSAGNKEIAKLLKHHGGRM